MKIKKNKPRSNTEFFRYIALLLIVIFFSCKSTPPPEEPAVEENDFVLDFSDASEVKKGIIYAEIFNRKYSN